MKFKVVALLMLIGTVGMAVSCQKEEIVKNENASKEVVTLKVNDDDPSIKGKVKKSNQLPVNKALVEVFDCETNTKIAETFTNGYGDFEQRVPVGVYYLKVTNPQSGNVTYTSKLRLDLLRLLDFIDIIVD